MYEEDNPAGGPSLSALQYIAEPLASNWMGLPWTKFCTLSMASIKDVPLRPVYIELSILWWVS